MDFDEIGASRAKVCVLCVTFGTCFSFHLLKLTLLIFNPNSPNLPTVAGFGRIRFNDFAGSGILVNI